MPCRMPAWSMSRRLAPPHCTTSPTPSASDCGAATIPRVARSIEGDRARGAAAVTEMYSPGEALMERRLAEIPTAEWGDVQVDIPPREYVLAYLAHSFPVQLYEPFTDSDGNLCSRPVY